MEGDNGPVCVSNECIAFDLKKKIYPQRVPAKLLENILPVSKSRNISVPYFSLK